MPGDGGLDALVDPDQVGVGLRQADFLFLGGGADVLLLSVNLADAVRQHALAHAEQQGAGTAGAVSGWLQWSGRGGFIVAVLVVLCGSKKLG